MKNVLTIEQDSLSELYDFTIVNKNNIIIFGPPGIGKTAMAEQAINKSGYKQIYVNLSVLEAPDFIGVPHIVNGRSAWAPPEFLPLIDDNTGETILLFDEIDKAKPELQAPLLELFQFRSINGKKTNVRAIISTGNRPEDMSFSMAVSHSLTNRCSVFNLSPNFDLWMKWAKVNSVSPLILSFLENDRDLFLKKNYHLKELRQIIYFMH